MAYDEMLGLRMRTALGVQPGVVEKRMFGGIGFLLNGNMACGVHKNYLIVRVGPEKSSAALERPYTRPFDMTGRPMAGWVMVEPQGCATEPALKAWLEEGLEFARSLPEK